MAPQTITFGWIRAAEPRKSVTIARTTGVSVLVAVPREVRQQDENKRYNELHAPSQQRDLGIGIFLTIVGSMRTLAHTTIAFFLVIGLVASSVSVASAFQMAGEMMPSASVDGSIEDLNLPLKSPMDKRQPCDPRSNMANCSMSHMQRSTAAMGCCGCFLSVGDALRINPLESRISGFATLNVTGDSRAPISLLKPPRA